MALFADTTSKDGHYALGWTVRPNRKKDPVDWSVYNPDDVGVFYEKYSFESNDGDTEKTDYALVDGVLDLKERKFTPLTSSFPYFPHKNHGSLNVTWSEDQHGTQYAVVANQAKFSTYDLWLLVLRPSGPQTVDLLPQANKKVKGYMQKRDPKDYQRYEAIYEPSDRPARDDDPSGGTFKDNRVTIPFSAEIPKSDNDYDVGTITFTLPKGDVLRVVPGKKSKPSNTNQ